MKTHGLSNSPIYNAWINMKQRCTNPNYRGYSDYGGRGIKVCQPWLTSFEDFNEDMGSSWQPGLELDRIDVNGNYEPGNCRWVTKSKQNRNKRPQWKSSVFWCSL